MAQFDPLRWLANRLHKPDPQPEDSHTDLLLAMVGNMTLSWGIVERVLDELIANYQHVATNLEREHPRNLTSKLDYLKRMQRDQRLSGTVREWLRVTRIEANRLGKERHEIVHGIIDRNPAVGPEWHSQRVIYVGSVARLKLRPFTTAQLQQVISDIGDLLADIAPKVWVLIHGDEPAYTPETIKTAKRELGLIE